jgi:acetate kinase
MSQRPSSILTINGGSSSLKFALFDARPPFEKTLAGTVEGIGQPGATVTVKGAGAGAGVARAVKAPDQAGAMAALMEALGDRLGKGGPVAVGHRVVHGGSFYSAPQRVTEAMLGNLETLIPFDPEHLPEEIQLVKAFQVRFPGLPQVACFDTAFHQGLPRVARLLPIPLGFQAQGMRRYGFHGLSYQFLMDELRRLDPAAAQGRVVLAHLGAGASLAAVKDGLSQDTSMGFTPTGGIPMGTRSGDLDPGLLLYLARRGGLDTDALGRLVNFQSGLLGLSGTSADMRELLGLEARDPRAADAVAVFCYQAKKCVGAFAAALGGLDTLVFAGGIGENAPAVRARICAGLEFLGVQLSPEANGSNAGIISGSASRVTVRMIRTDEERVIARAVTEILGA